MFTIFAWLLQKRLIVTLDIRFLMATNGTWLQSPAFSRPHVTVSPAWRFSWNMSTSMCQLFVKQWTRRYQKQMTACWNGLHALYPIWRPTNIQTVPGKSTHQVKFNWRCSTTARSYPHCRGLAHKVVLVNCKAIFIQLAPIISTYLTIWLLLDYLFQVTWKRVYKTTSSKEIGTLYHPRMWSIDRMWQLNRRLQCQRRFFSFSLLLAMCLEQPRKY